MITALLAIAVVGIVGFGVALAVRSKKEFDEQNEVVPGRKSPAPASWAGAHSREAKLHRRLGDAVKGARANPRFAELGLAQQMATIEAEAMAIDERLVAAASLPAAHRDAAIDPLEANVIDLEAAIVEMVTSVTVADSKATLEEAVSAADEKLRALAEARQEIEQIDRRVSGEITVDGVAMQSPPPAAPSPAPPPPPAPPTTSPPPPMPPPEQGTARD